MIQGGQQEKAVWGKWDEADDQETEWQLKKHSPGATSVNKRDCSYPALTIHLPTSLGFRPKQLRLLEKLLRVPISHQGQHEQMGLQSDTKGMEDSRDKWGSEGILV